MMGSLIHVLMHLALVVLNNNVACQYMAEYCEAEMFNPRCPEGQVIVMKHARYGRMQLGRCVTINLGYLGCQKDVLALADQRCSGQRACLIRLPDTTFDDTKPCLGELKTYLVADYECVDVLLPKQNCDFNAPGIAYHVANTSGFLSSAVTTVTNCGSGSFPWTLVAPVGQRLRFTVYNFETIRLKEELSFDQCREYATVSDRKSRQAIRVCRGTMRVQEALISANNSVDVHLHTSGEGGDYNFLIHYEVLGCADLHVTEPLRFRRLDDMTAVLRCQHTHDEWKLQCQAGVWQGMQSNCTLADNGAVFDDVADDDGNTDTLVAGMPLAIIIALALFVGLVVFLVGLILLYRLQKTDPRKPPDHQEMVYDMAEMPSIRSSNQTPVPMCKRLHSGSTDKIYEKYRFSSERYTPVHHACAAHYAERFDEQTCVKSFPSSTKPVLLRTNGCDVESVVFEPAEVSNNGGGGGLSSPQRVLLFPVCECLSEVPEANMEDGACTEEVDQDHVAL